MVSSAARIFTELDTSVHFLCEFVTHILLLNSYCVPDVMSQYISHCFNDVVRPCTRIL